MRFTKTQITVLELFVSRILDRFTIRQASRLTKKDLKIVYTSIQGLITNEFLLKTANNALGLNYKKNTQDLAYIENLRKEKFFKKHSLIKIHISNFLSKTRHKFLVLLVFGSYAAGKETKNSDVDLLALTPSGSERLEKELNAALSTSNIKFHVNVISPESFREMLSKRDELNVVNETFNSHIILYGAEQYYALVGERDVR